MSSILLHPDSKYEVLKYINTIINNNSRSHNNINNKIIKMLSEYLNKPITHIINIISTGISSIYLNILQLRPLIKQVINRILIIHYCHSQLILIN